MCCLKTDELLSLNILSANTVAICSVDLVCLLNGIIETIQVTMCSRYVPLGPHVGQPCYAALSGSIYKWRCVLCEVGTECLYLIHMNVSIPRVYKNQLQNIYWII